MGDEQREIEKTLSPFVEMQLQLDLTFYESETFLLNLPDF